MIRGRARGRHLAALGLIAAVGCREAGPSSTASSTSAVMAPPLSTVAAAATGSPVTHRAEPWVPQIEPELVKPGPGTGDCQRGVFCVPYPAAPGASTAPAPYQTCYHDVTVPPGIGPPLVGDGRYRPGSIFDAALTAAERAKDPAACCYQWQRRCAGTSGQVAP